MKRLNDVSGGLALVALILSLVAAVGGVASATGLLVNSAQIKNGTIHAVDIHTNGVPGAKITNGTVGSADVSNGSLSGEDVANNSLDGEDVEVPEPAEVTQTTTSSALIQGEGFSLVDLVGTVIKESADSELEVTWSGSGTEGQELPEHAPCIFQLRVDGKAPGGGGEVSVSGTESAGASSLFSGLSEGPHQIEVWARHSTPTETTCAVGGLGIDQSFIVQESVG